MHYLALRSIVLFYLNDKYKTNDNVFHSTSQSVRRARECVKCSA